MAIGNGVGVIFGTDAGVGEDASMAVAEEVIIGETGELNGDTVETTGFELQAALPSNTSKRIKKNLRGIRHLIKHAIRLSS
jgi:hypothetical protein